MLIYYQDTTKEVDDSELDYTKGRVVIEHIHNADGSCTKAFIFKPYTPAELAQRRIAKLKAELQRTDYQAIKFAEGELSAEEYAETKTQRRAWREEINALEAKIAEEEGA